MKKYKLNKDKKLLSPSKQKMESQKDFGKLFHHYEKFTKRPKKPLYKDPKYFFFLLILVVLAYFISEYAQR